MALIAKNRGNQLKLGNSPKLIKKATNRKKDARGDWAKWAKDNQKRIK